MIRPKIAYLMAIFFYLAFLPHALTRVSVLADFWPYQMEGCMNTKDILLRKTTNTSRVSYHKRRKKNCHIKSGRWTDAFSGEELRAADDIIVAPIIPLSHLKYLKVNWSKKKLFNFVRESEVLIHFAKGGISQMFYLGNAEQLVYVPKTFAQRCEFFGMWMDTKSRWSIPFQEGEKARIGRELLNCLKESSYNRAETFGDWFRLTGSRCDSRIEVLRRDGGAWSNSGKGCNGTLNGSWHDLYTDRIFHSTTGLDIDHMVPLKNAYINGAWRWPKWKKREYANNLLNPFHLLAVDLSENRKKSANHPGLYMPPNKSYHCEYLKNWVGIKFRWQLKIAQDEGQSIIQQLKNCAKTNLSDYREVINFLAHDD